jgi:hypothetical protein
MKRILLTILALSLLFLVCAGPGQSRASEVEPKGQQPVIVDSYAASTVRPGNSWRVYLRAKDDNGNMKSIVATLSGPGSGSPQTSITQLKKKYSQELAGYIWLKIPLDRGILNRTYTLQVFVRDSKENKSETVEFPLAFDLKKKSEKVPPEWQDVEDKKIGTIMIEIRGEKERMNQGGF